jgi:predicted anti-sigma-YlaC factor YlaD
MDCENIKELLPLYLNNELDDQQFKEVQKHLDSCSGCRSELDDIQELDTLLKTHLKPETTPQFRSSRIKSKKRYYYLSAVAAALVLYIIFSTVQPDKPELTWENYRITELMEMNDNLDIVDSDARKQLAINGNTLPTEDEELYSIGEDVDYLQTIEN